MKHLESKLGLANNDDEVQLFGSFVLAVFHLKHTAKSYPQGKKLLT